MGETGKGWEDMSIIQIMVTIIIVTILVTVILGVASYAAYWLRRNRRPARREAESDEPRFFFRYRPPGEADGAEAAGVAPGPRTDASSRATHRAYHQGA